MAQFDILKRYILYINFASELPHFIEMKTFKYAIE